MDNSVLHRNHGPSPTRLDWGKNNEKRTGWNIQNNYAAMHHDGDVVNTRLREGILARADREGLVAADVDNLSSTDFDSFCDAAWEVFGEEAPIVKIYTVEGNDPYEVEIIGVKGAYMVRASEFDDKGLFGTLKEAEACVEFNWLGQAEEDSMQLDATRAQSITKCRLDQFIISIADVTELLHGRDYFRPPPRIKLKEGPIENR